MEPMDEVPNITMSNTKKEMLAAYHEMKELLASQATAVRDAEREKAELRKEAARAAADRAAAGEPINLIQELRTRMAVELSRLEDEYQQLTQDHRQLEEAVTDRKADLERVYEVESAAEDLVALIEGHRRLKEELAAEMEMARAAWQREKKAHDQEVEREREALERRRAWEEEEYEYSTTREREKRRNELEDELAALERELASRREALEAEAAGRAAELDRREEALAASEETIHTLEERVAGFEEELARRTAQATGELREQLAREYAAKEALLKAQFEGEANVLKGRIEGLEQLVQRQAKQIELLTAEQQDAYRKVQEIASKALDSAKPGAGPSPDRFTVRPRRDEGEE